MALMHRCIEFTGFVEIFQRQAVSIATVIFLSCKVGDLSFPLLTLQVDENTRTLREVLSVVRKLLNLTKSSWIEEDEVPSCSLPPSIPHHFLPPQAIVPLKKDVIVHEQYILRAIQFKTHVDVPHKYLLNFARPVFLSPHSDWL
jgi:hypothetical protein